ncbi:MAG: hypothetical protein Q8Q40_03310 [Methylococcaceae bacterium]|nr:hypothetical protein [Methylococcaceae bacterium]MDP3902986.1 hypothetical protein [Methylococcaceae bacterium]
MTHFLPADIEQMQSQHAFIARGLSSRDQARRTGEYFTAEDVLSDLDAMLIEVETQKSSSGGSDAFVATKASLPPINKANLDNIKK